MRLQWVLCASANSSAPRTLNCCEENTEKVLFGFPGRGDGRKEEKTISGPCPWRRRAKKKCLQYFSCDSSAIAANKTLLVSIDCENETEDRWWFKKARRFFSFGCKQNETRSVKGPSWCLTFHFASSLPAKNQGISITKNSTSTTLHNDQQGSSNTRFHVETSAINGYQASKNELDIAMLGILDPHLRPVPPAPNEPTSQKIYKEHMDLAQEYFKVSLTRDIRCKFPITSACSTESNRNRVSEQTQRESAARHGARRAQPPARHLQQA